MATLFDQHPGEICAVILEPRLQCAGGMRMHDPVYRRACHATPMAFMIADRSPPASAAPAPCSPASRPGVMPDLMCLSRA